MCKINKDEITIFYLDTEDGSCETIGRYFGAYRTSGLRKFGYKELCIPFQIPLEKAVKILNNLVDTIIYDDDLEINKGRIHGQLKWGYDLGAIEYSSEDTLYILIPDENNLFPKDEGCNRMYYAQWYYAKCIHELGLV